MGNPNLPFRKVNVTRDKRLYSRDVPSNWVVVEWSHSGLRSSFFSTCTCFVLRVVAQGSEPVPDPSTFYPRVRTLYTGPDRCGGCCRGTRPLFGHTIVLWYYTILFARGRGEKEGLETSSVEWNRSRGVLFTHRLSFIFYSEGRWSRY